VQAVYVKFILHAIAMTGEVPCYFASLATHTKTIAELLPGEFAMAVIAGFQAFFLFAFLENFISAVLYAFNFFFFIDILHPSCCGLPNGVWFTENRSCLRAMQTKDFRCFFDRYQISFPIAHRHPFRFLVPKKSPDTNPGLYLEKAIFLPVPTQHLRR
jgi:hypothetical protein